MNILIAPNSMKGSLNAFDFADIVEKAFMDCSLDFNLRKVPVADGGDFTGEVLCRNLNANEVHLTVRGPLGEKVKSKYAVSGQSAIIEMADASGMKLIGSNHLNPLEASSFGTGQLIEDAIKRGCTEILLAIGGSATVDGGMGMMEALGFIFYDKFKNIIPGNGRNLKEVDQIKSNLVAKNTSFRIICDVDNPLLGETGAAVIFGPQKGATPKMVLELENGLKNWVELLEKQSDKNLKPIKGAGAAGGIAVPLIAFFDAEMVQGSEFILNQLKFREHVNWADLVITGEGKIDSQTLNNKAPYTVAKFAHEKCKPVIAIGGKVEKDASDAFNGIYSIINEPLQLKDAMENADKILYNFSFELARTIDALKGSFNG